MKVKPIIASIATLLTLSIAGTAFARHVSANSYYPPERINCSKSGNKINCEGFSHVYLVEDTYTAGFNGDNQVFAFVSGAAYYNADKTEANIFYTYRNSDMKIVKLKTLETNMRPDFEDGNWQHVQDDLFICKDGYMSCPIVRA